MLLLCDQTGMEPSCPGKLSSMLMQLRMTLATPSTLRQLQCKDTLKETSVYVVPITNGVTTEAPNEGMAMQGKELRTTRMCCSDTWGNPSLLP